MTTENKPTALIGYQSVSGSAARAATARDRTAISPMISVARAAKKGYGPFSVGKGAVPLFLVGRRWECGTRLDCIVVRESHRIDVWGTTAARLSSSSPGGSRRGREVTSTTVGWPMACARAAGQLTCGSFTAAFRTRRLR